MKPSEKVSPEWLERLRRNQIPERLLVDGHLRRIEITRDWAAIEAYDALLTRNHATD